LETLRPALADAAAMPAIKVEFTDNSRCAFPHRALRLLSGDGPLRAVDGADDEQVETEGYAVLCQCSRPLAAVVLTGRNESVLPVKATLA